jgi:hypothetical protein
LGGISIIAFDKYIVANISTKNAFIFLFCILHILSLSSNYKLL